MITPICCRSKPNEHLTRIPVDIGHLLHLLHFLFCFLLIDTYGVDPESQLFRIFLQLLESNLKFICDGKRLVVDQDLSASTTPAIG